MLTRCLDVSQSVTRIATFKLAKRRSFSGQGGLLNRMFGSSMPGKDESIVDSDTPNSSMNSSDSRLSRSSAEKNGSASPSRDRKDEASPAGERKRRSSGVAKAKDIFSNARQTLHLHSSSPKPTDDRNLSPMQKLSASDPALGVPQGSFNNSAGESRPGPNSTFRVGVTEDKNKKCRRTMEDTHAYLYNFLSTPAPATLADGEEKEKESKPRKSSSSANASEASIQETDNGYFAIFDGHAGTFAADWCGKKLHHILEDTIRKNPNTPIPELLDQTFTIVDQQLEKLPLKNSGCTAAIALLRWEDRVPNPVSATGSTYLNQAVAKAESTKDVKSDGKAENENSVQTNSTSAANDISGERTSISSEKPLKELASRQRVLYTANVGDARIVLCRNGRALRLSYDHKGSDENEGRRVANAGGLILNNRVNGVLAVTRALGDAYMKDLVTGHPYTTETVIQPDHDEFIVLACDGVSAPSPLSQI